MFQSSRTDLFSETGELLPPHNVDDAKVPAPFEELLALPLDFIASHVRNLEEITLLVAISRVGAALDVLMNRFSDQLQQLTRLNSAAPKIWKCTEPMLWSAFPYVRDLQNDAQRNISLIFRHVSACLSSLEQYRRQLQQCVIVNERVADELAYQQCHEASRDKHNLASAQQLLQQRLSLLLHNRVSILQTATSWPEVFRVTNAATSFESPSALKSSGSSSAPTTTTTTTSTGSAAAARIIRDFVDGVSPVPAPQQLQSSSQPSRSGEFQFAVPEPRTPAAAAVAVAMAAATPGATQTPASAPLVTPSVTAMVARLQHQQSSQQQHHQQPPEDEVMQDVGAAPSTDTSDLTAGQAEWQSRSATKRKRTPVSDSQLSMQVEASQHSTISPELSLTSSQRDTLLFPLPDHHTAPPVAAAPLDEGQQEDHSSQQMSDSSIPAPKHVRRLEWPTSFQVDLNQELSGSTGGGSVDITAAAAATEAEPAEQPKQSLPDIAPDAVPDNVSDAIAPDDDVPARMQLELASQRSAQQSQTPSSQEFVAPPLTTSSPILPQQQPQPSQTSLKATAGSSGTGLSQQLNRSTASDDLIAAPPAQQSHTRQSSQHSDSQQQQQQQPEDAVASLLHAPHLVDDEDSAIEVLRQQLLQPDETGVEFSLAPVLSVQSQPAQPVLTLAASMRMSWEAGGGVFLNSQDSV
eukprot:TRINITY_DN9950_c0_g1_i1.p1 TRINITY_DN9950_c0_g1~~TRINITY_DN9950_c0_g1_i1.p1  ORF type:complete len:691 (+),score=184.74 TRINITY_DN9950_c0_g1_i1:93-2165(+)